MSTLRSRSVSPEAFSNETGRNAKLRAAGNLAETVIPGRIGEEVRMLLWACYGTSSAPLVEGLARAIIAANPTTAG